MRHKTEAVPLVKLSRQADTVEKQNPIRINAEVSAVWSEWEKQRAKEAEAKMKSTLKQNTASSNLNERKEEPIRTAAEVAKKIGVSENTYRDMN